MARDCGPNALSLLPENVLPQWQQKLHEVQFFAGIGPAHFLAETTRPLGRGCLQFSPSLYILILDAKW